MRGSQCEGCDSDSNSDSNSDSDSNSNSNSNSDSKRSGEASLRARKRRWQVIACRANGARGDGARAEG